MLNKHVDVHQYILRKAFDCAPEGKAYLPDSILWCVANTNPLSDNISLIPSFPTGVKKSSSQTVSGSHGSIASRSTLESSYRTKRWLKPQSDGQRTLLKPRRHT